MKDPVKFVKSAYQTLLTDAIEFSGSPVKFAIGEVSIADNNSYMVLSNINAVRTNNKHQFEYEVTVSLDVYSKQKVLLSDPFNPVDVIAERALDLIIPSINSTGLDNSVDFEFKNWGLVDTNYSPVESYDANRLMRRQINIIQTLIQL